MDIEGHEVDVNLVHHIQVQRFAKEESRRAADRCQHCILTKHIGGRLVFVESQHLDRRDLADPLRDVDVVQVVEHDERKRRRACDDDKHDVIHTAHHARKACQHIRIDGDCRHVVRLHQRRARRVDIRLLRQINIEIFVGQVTECFLICPGIQIYIIVNIILADAAHDCLDLPAVLVNQMDRVADPDAIPLRQLLTDDRLAVLRVRECLPCRRVQIDIAA